MPAEALHREFAALAVPSSGGRLLLRPADAARLIDRAAEAGIPIVRIDGFSPGPGEPRSAEDGADFSAEVAEGHGCWSEAEAFLRERADRELVFELTLGADPINAA